jgi:hypothetical protein
MLTLLTLQAFSSPVKNHQYYNLISINYPTPNISLSFDQKQSQPRPNLLKLTYQKRCLHNMCIETFARYRCGCTSTQLIGLHTVCKYRSRVRRLKNDNGATEDDIKVQTLRATCRNSSTARYEAQPFGCQSCMAATATAERARQE